jgi:hypothetical protein
LPRCTVAFDLIELIAIDRDVASRPQLARPARKRPQHGENGRDRHQYQCEPQRHRIELIKSKIELIKQNSTFRWPRRRKNRELDRCRRPPSAVTSRAPLARNGE